MVDVLRVPGHTRDVVLFEDAAQQMEAYAQLRKHCEAGDFDVLWARDPDRLGRDPALAQTVASLVIKSGGEVYVASAPHVLGQQSTGQRYVYAIQSVRAQEDQQTRVRYIRMGMRQRIARGLVPNHWPIGYRALKDPLSGETTGGELDELAPAVRLATRLFLQGTSYERIVAALDGSPYRPPNAASWHYGTVYKMLQSDVYGGMVSWGEYRNPEPSDSFPHLWDTATFEAVQRERSRRSRKTYARSDGNPFLDVAYCARCGSRMTQATNTAQDTVYLRCSSHVRRNQDATAECHANYTHRELVREAIASFLAGIAGRGDVERLRGAQRQDTRERARLGEIEGELEDADRRRRRLALAYASGAMDMLIYQAADQEIVRQVEAWKEERGEIEVALASTVGHEARLAAVRSVRPLLAAGLDGAGSRELAMLLQNAGVRVWCEDGAVVRVEMI